MMLQYEVVMHGHLDAVCQGVASSRAAPKQSAGSRATRARAPRVRLSARPLSGTRGSYDSALSGTDGTRRRPDDDLADGLVPDDLPQQAQNRTLLHDVNHVHRDAARGHPVAREGLFV